MNNIFLIFVFIFSNVFCFSKTYDCFLFFNELELLKIRFEELNDVVDYFVLVESSETFRGKEKELVFFLNANSFDKKYLDKIVYLECPKFSSDDPWKREKYQRDYISYGLKDCCADDLIMVSDVDEIPNSEIVQNLKKQRKKFLIKPQVFDQRLFRFYLNFYESQWPGTMISSYKLFKKIGANSFRNLRHSAAKISNGGWHFSSLGGEETILYKLASFSHAEHDIFKKGDWEKIVKFYSPNAVKIPLDQSYPKYILNNLEFYRNIGFILD